MQYKHGLAAASALTALLVLAGCPENTPVTPPPKQPIETTGSGGMADAVPISVSVVEDPQNSNKLDVTVAMNDTVAANTDLFVYFDVRNTAVADPNLHVDPEMVLSLNPTVRTVTCLAREKTVEFKVDLAATRSINAEVNISVMAAIGQDKRGASGKKTVPATPPPTPPSASPAVP